VRACGRTNLNQFGSLLYAATAFTCNVAKRKEYYSIFSGMLSGAFFSINHFRYIKIQLGSDA